MHTRRETTLSSYSSGQESKSNDLNPIIIVTGISGCGKDFLMSRLEENWSEENMLPILGFGQMLFEQLSDIQIADGLDTRDDLREGISATQLVDATNAVCDRILALAPAVVSSHVLYHLQGGLHVIPTIEQKLKASLYIYVHAEPRRIHEWRSVDVTRRRVAEDLFQTDLHQAMQLSLVGVIAEKLGSKLLVIHNSPDDLSANLDLINQECLQVLRKFV